MTCIFSFKMDKRESKENADFGKSDKAQDGTVSKGTKAGEIGNQEHMLKFSRKDIIDKTVESLLKENSGQETNEK